MQKHVDNVQDFEGNAVSGVTVTIRVTLTQALATIFSDNLSPVPTPLANPFTNDSDGEFFFFAPNDEYDIILSGGAAETRPNITLFDPDDALIRGPVLVGSTPGPTAVALGQVIVADVTANAVILTLPTDPGAAVQFPDIVVQHLVGDITTNNVTIQRNGELIGGVAADLVMTSPNESVRLIWAGSANGWAVQRIGDGSAGSLGGLTDVTLTAPATGAILYKSAGDWLDTTALLVNPAGVLEGQNNGVPVWRTTTVAAGGLTVDNQLTGGGFERVLTTSDTGNKVTAFQGIVLQNVPSTTLVNITNMVLTPLATGNYKFEAYIPVAFIGGGTPGNFNLAWVLGSTVPTCDIIGELWDVGAGLMVDVANDTSLLSGFALTPTNPANNHVIRITGTLVQGGTPGTIQLQMARTGASGTLDVGGFAHMLIEQI